MADLSSQVEQVLENFKQDFDMVKEETGTIAGITFQTNLLAVNASIAVSYTHLDVYKRQHLPDQMSRLRKYLN